MLRQLYNPKGTAMKTAVFLSGKGSVARSVIAKSIGYEIAMIFSDSNGSNAAAIAKEYKIPYACIDIHDFYRAADKPLSNMNVRKKYDAKTAALLKKHGVQAVALCGYMSIVTDEIYDNFLTVNVHPADLRLLGSGGRRILAGCTGKSCIEKARQLGYKEVRSTTHLVTKNVDGGPVFLVSAPVKITGEAEECLEQLKKLGDCVIFPETLRLISAGNFWIDDIQGVIIDLIDEKSLLREGMKKLREQMSSSEVSEKSSAIQKKLLQFPAYKKASVVMLYSAIKNEVETSYAIRQALGGKKIVALPRTDVQNRRIAVTQVHSQSLLKKGSFGIVESGGKELKAAEIELIVVPGIAFDSEGNRIGYGHGYYDAFLKKTKAKKIALAYELQIVDKIRTTPNDIKMDAIITEERIIECGVGA